MKRNSLGHFLNDPYVQINTILAGVIVAILLYSGIFSSSSHYPIPSYYESVTGKSAPSSGLSRAFSQIVRFNLDQAKAFNPYSLRIFSFFALQLLLRLFFSWWWIVSTDRRTRIAIIDAVISATAFVYTFYPFLVFLFKEINDKV